MAKKLLALAVGMTIASWSSAAMACDGQDKTASGAKVSLVKDTTGFEDGSGILYGVKLVSEKLYNALVGFEINKDKMRCPSCKTAFEHNGQCEHCRIGIADGKAYRSPVSYRLAKGKVITEELMSSCPKQCGECKKAYTENGRCEECKVGFVAGRMYTTDEDYKAAQAAHAVLVRAAKAATMCESCATAMVTDGTCDHCKVKFKDGQMARNDG